MLIIPAIDLKDGQCVRLKQGLMEDATVFSDSPATMARHWVTQGARRLHLVDLNGAFAGKPKNESAIKAILREVGDDIPVQLGGGIRDLDTIERCLDDGLTYVIIGTAAVKNPGFLHDACTAFPGHIIVGLDAKDGKVATDGWSKLTGHDVVDLGKKFEDYGVESIIYTDIGRDGMLSGINIEATVRLAQALTIPVIASGGLSNLDDIRQLLAVESEGVIGTIAGRAIYDGSLDFKAAQEASCSWSPLMLAKRIIPCLDVTAGRVVKGNQFCRSCVMLVIRSRSPAAITSRGPTKSPSLILRPRPISATSFCTSSKPAPSRFSFRLTVGGGVRKVEDVRRLLNAGADKVSMNTAAVQNPDLVFDASSKVGSQCIVVAIDAKQVAPGMWHVFHPRWT